MTESPYSPSPTNSQVPPQSQPTIPPQMPYGATPKITPSAGWYLLSTAFLLAGIICAIVLFAQSIGGFIKIAASMSPVDVPGQIEKYLDKPGTYALYWPHHTNNRGGYDPEDVKITVTCKGEKQPLNLSKSKAEINMNIGEQQFQVLYTFSLSKPDVVTVSTKLADPEDTTGTTQIVMGSFFSEKDIISLGLRILGGIAAGLGGFLIALLIFIITIVKRSGCKRRMQMANPTQANPPHSP